MREYPESANYMAIELLAKLGLYVPTQEQIDLMEALAANVTIKKSIYFNSCLSKRERDCLFWSACGKSSKEIATLFDIKVSTVHWHKRKILQKLDCRTISQAVFVGIRYGYFSKVCAY